MRRRRGNQVLVFSIGIGMVLLVIYLLSSLLMSSERQAKRVVVNFYEFESSADYGRSWELLHSEMQTKFSRGSYIQDRAHVFNGHFGADTFSFDVSGAKEIKNWKMEKDGEVLGTVYEFEVRQNYHGKYGHFVFVQYVYVASEEGEWRILWDYKK